MLLAWGDGNGAAKGMAESFRAKTASSFGSM